MPLFRRDPPEKRFWKWFAENSDELHDFEKDQTGTFAKLRHALKSVHPDLTFEFGPITDGKREFTISADGLKAAVPAVSRLFATCPPLSRWNIVAFRQRIDLARFGPLEYEGLALPTEHLSFRSEPDQGTKLGLEIFVRGHDLSDERVNYAVFILLDMSLGEYDVVTKIGYIEILPWTEDTPNEGLRPFHDLPAVVDGYLGSAGR